MVIKPVIFASLFTIILVYTGLVPVYRTSVLRSLVPQERVTEISGIVSSPPVRTASGNSYRMNLQITRVWGTDAAGNTVWSDAHGTVPLYVDAGIIEALYPGRLYSRLKGRQAQLIEQGAVLHAQVRYFSNDRSSGFSTGQVTVSGYRDRISWFRALCRLQCKRILYTWGSGGGLLLALLSGEREYTDETLAEAFRLAGLSHILALSGMHLSLFSNLTQRMTRKKLGVRGAAVCGLCAAAVFVWFAGATPSLVRALLGMVLGWLCRRLSVNGSGIELLALTFLIQTALFPAHTGQVAFMLSYGALLGVYLGDAVLHPVLRRLLPGSLASGVSSSVDAFCCTAGISLSVFGMAQPFGVIASVLVTPLAEWFVTAGIAGLVAALAVPFLLVPVGAILGIPYKVLQFLVQTFARLPGITLNEDL